MMQEHDRGGKSQREDRGDNGIGKEVLHGRLKERFAEEGDKGMEEEGTGFRVKGTGLGNFLIPFALNPVPLTLFWLGPV
jgi:hypothetical protein